MNQTIKQPGNPHRSPASSCTFLCTQVSSFVSGTALRVKNLTVGRDYDFRVSAENQYGISDPCPTSEPVKARHPFGECTARGGRGSFVGRSAPVNCRPSLQSETLLLLVDG